MFESSGPSKLHPSDPRVGEALQAFADSHGMLIDQVLLPTQWAVVMIDGRPELVINADGMRALALVSPDPDASSRVEQFIQAWRAAR